MGYTIHHSIIVTGFQHDAVIQAYSEAVKLFGNTGIAAVTGVIHARVNEWHTFLVGPDGSKEGWADSDRGDEARRAFISWLVAAKGRGLYLDWAEVAMPEDGPPRIERSHELECSDT